MMTRIAVIASQKDVAPVFRCQFRTVWSSGFAAAAFVLAAAPGAVVPGSGGQSEIAQSPSRETPQYAGTSQPAHAPSVVVVTGAFDLGKITAADFGDAEPSPR